MPIAWWGLLGLFAAVLVNRAADCWLNSARLQCDLTRHPGRQLGVWVGIPATYMVLAARLSYSDDLGKVCVFATILILLAVIDLEQRRVPNVVVLPAIALTLVHAWYTGQLASAAFGMVVAFGVFLAFYALGRRIFGPGALGMGDVKLAALIGAMIGLEWILYTLLAGILLAGVVAAGLLLSGRARRGDSLPFGYFMALAALAVLMAGYLTR